MSEPAKPTDTANKATDDFVTKYKVRLSFRGCRSTRLQEVEILLTSLSNRLGFPSSLLRFDLLRCTQLAADIVNNAVKKIIPLCVEGAKILDICLEGDKLIEQGTGAVWNKSVKGVKVLKGEILNHSGPLFWTFS